MNYFDRPEVSNSDLSKIKRMLYSEDATIPDEAYRFGTLVDAVITEPQRVDFLKFTVDNETYTEDEFRIAKEMKKSFLKDPLCKMMIDNSEMQKVMVKKVDFDYYVPFSLDCRCKWDLWMPKFLWGGDIKSTLAKTQKQFDEACRHFDYDRQRFFYMNLAGSKQDILIGISKVNFNVFKIPIRAGDEFYLSGRHKCHELAFKYYTMFGNIKVA